MANVTLKNSFIQENNLHIPNKEWRNAFITLFIGFIGFVVMSLPILDEDTFKEFIGPMVFLGFFVGVTSIVIFFLFRKRALMLDEIRQGKNILIHWKYDKPTWEKFIQKDTQEKQSSAKALMKATTIIMIIVALIFLIADEFSEASIQTFLVIFLVWILVFGLGYSYNKATLNNRIKKEGEVIISPNALWLSGQFHTWRGYGSRLEEISYDEKAKTLTLYYSFKVRHGRSTETFELPIPANKEAEAINLIKFFNDNFRND
ncbi:hypothetical protein [Raineya orbicola]|jgi:hypothetical protein|uniref:Uncharacterized protein n=1 Tax=Raineya orbicola TaxID=2016530 RepID=A0A2N3IE30_9BACT|nr:hypothetical protein [Raineya orbicola]PKQ68556.1 hypothetical protein Rain11_1623 [Raineya orbicola]